MTLSKISMPPIASLRKLGMGAGDSGLNHLLIDKVCPYSFLYIKKQLSLFYFVVYASVLFLNPLILLTKTSDYPTNTPTDTID
jgi:hypothetical protein